MRNAVARGLAYLLVVVMFFLGLYLQEQNKDDDDARACVASWQTRGDIRDMAEKAYRRNAETLVSLAGQANPDRIATYQRQVEQDVVEIRSTLPDPSCDLDAALERLD